MTVGTRLRGALPAALALLLPARRAQEEAGDFGAVPAGRVSFRAPFVARRRW